MKCFDCGGKISKEKKKQTINFIVEGNIFSTENISCFNCLKCDQKYIDEDDMEDACDKFEITYKGIFKRKNV